MFEVLDQVEREFLESSMEALKERRVSFSVEAEMKAKNVKHTRRWRQRNESGEEAVAIVTEGD